jgi:hypothetical protein
MLFTGVRGRGILGSSLSGYRASTGPGYPSGCPGLYNACIVGRVVTHFSTHTTRPSLYAPATLRGTSGGASMSTSGGAGTPAHCARHTGFYHRVGALLRTGLRPFALPRPDALISPPRSRSLRRRIIPGGMILPSPVVLANRGGAMQTFTPARTSPFGDSRKLAKNSSGIHRLLLNMRAQGATQRGLPSRKEVASV